MTIWHTMREIEGEKERERKGKTVRETSTEEGLSAPPPKSRWWETFFCAHIAKNERNRDNQGEHSEKELN